MDLSQLEQQLETALQSVITEETQLQAAIDAVKAVLPTAPVADPAWAAVQAALEANGWTAPAPASPPADAPPADAPPADAPAPDAPAQ